MGDFLLSVDNLCVSYPGSFGFFSRSRIPILKNVSLKIKKGETLGIVGESGSGKTTLGRSIVRLIPIDSGRVFFKTHCISDLKEDAFLPYRRKIQMVFQDPFDALNPKMTIEQILEEPLYIHFQHLSAFERKKRKLKLLEWVKMPRTYLKRYPNALSGGQRQRIGIALALAVEPEVLICDEPVSALDVSIQAAIMNLLKDLQTALKLTYLFISHDMAIVRYISHEVAVMQAGKIIEHGSAESVYKNPQNIYTKQLLAAVPRL